MFSLRGLVESGVNGTALDRREVLRSFREHEHLRGKRSHPKSQKRRWKSWGEFRGSLWKTGFWKEGAVSCGSTGEGPLSV